MFNLIPISLLIMALGGVIYIVSYHLSEFEENDETADSGFSFKAKLAGWINQLPWNNMKVQSLSFAQKFLHRMRIILLKTDNRLMDLIRKISEKDKEINGNGNEKNLENNNNFWDDISRNKQESALKTKIEFADAKSDEVIKKVDGILTNQVSKMVGVKLVKKVSKPKR